MKSTIDRGCSAVKHEVRKSATIARGECFIVTALRAEYDKGGFIKKSYNRSFNNSNGQ